MKTKIYNQILQTLTELSVDTEDNTSVLLCYLLAQLNIEYSVDETTLDGTNSADFSNAVAKYGLALPLPKYIHDVRFSSFTHILVQNNLHSDYRSFLEYLTPRLVSQWNIFRAATSNMSPIDILVILYLTLTETSAFQLRFDEINQEIIDEIYRKQAFVFQHLNLTADNFAKIWEAVFYIPMPKLKVAFSKKLIDTVKFYRKYKVSGLALVENYCYYNKYKTRLDVAINPWTEFERAIGKSPTMSGVSIAESAFMLIKGISKELPTDIIRAAIYPHPEFFSKSSGISIKPNNDGRFECSFLIEEFYKLARVSSRILIVNPGLIFFFVGMTFQLILTVNAPSPSQIYTLLLRTGCSSQTSNFVFIPI